MNDRVKQKLARLQTAPKRPAPPAGTVDRLKHEVAVLKGNPRRAARVLGRGALLLVALGYLWRTRSVETWLEIEPTELQVSPGATQTLTVSLMRKPRFLVRASAGPSEGTIQLISFPRAVDVTPTTVVTTEGSPRAALQVRGVRFGEEELVFAGSHTPSVEASWQTLAMRVMVVPGSAPARR